MTTAMPHHQREIGPYQLFILSLCVWAIFSLGVGTVMPMKPTTRTILDYADTAVCGVFFLDFLYSLYRSPNRIRYLIGWGWIDLLSSIPTIGVFRFGRAARIMRILRVLRGVRSARAIAHFVVARRAESAFLASILLCILLMVVCSIAVLQFEVPAGGNIQTAEDAMWWAMSTMTTVGYGDMYPTTSEGRFIAVFLMAAGVGVFGTLAGLTASWFLSPAAEEVDSDLVEIRDALRALNGRLDTLRMRPDDGGSVNNTYG